MKIDVANQRILVLKDQYTKNKKFEIYDFLLITKFVLKFSQAE